MYRTSLHIHVVVCKYCIVGIVYECGFSSKISIVNEWIAAWKRKKRKRKINHAPCTQSKWSKQPQIQKLKRKIEWKRNNNKTMAAMQQPMRHSVCHEQRLDKCAKRINWRSNEWTKGVGVYVCIWVYVRAHVCACAMQLQCNRIQNKYNINGNVRQNENRSSSPCVSNTDDRSFIRKKNKVNYMRLHEHSFTRAFVFCHIELLYYCMHIRTS